MSSALHHYTEAERLLANSTDMIKKREAQGVTSNTADAQGVLTAAGHLVAKAQAHATLALAAITATAVLGENYIELAPDDVAGWVEAVLP